MIFVSSVDELACLKFMFNRFDYLERVLSGAHMASYFFSPNFREMMRNEPNRYGNESNLADNASVQPDSPVYSRFPSLLTLLNHDVQIHSRTNFPTAPLAQQPHGRMI